MQFSAVSKYVRVSPYKLRPIINVIRGKSVSQSQAYLRTHLMQKMKPILSALDSAYANAQNLSGSDKILPEDLVVKSIFVDQGPILRYHKPAAMGRASIQRKRLSQITVILEKKI